MKQTKKTSPKRPPGRPVKPDPVARQVIGSRVTLELYQKLAEAAATNRQTLAVEFERRLERSFEPSPINPDSELHALGLFVMTAFEVGARLGEKPGRPIAELLKDSMSFNRGAIRAVEALLDRHPDPRWADFMLLLFAIRDRLAAIWRATDAPSFEKGRPLPDFNDPEAEAFWRTSYPPASRKGED